jgi:hypothetical protein
VRRRAWILLALSLAAFLTLPAMATSESGTLQASHFGWVAGESPDTGTANVVDATGLYIEFSNIEDYSELTLYQAFVPDDGDYNYGDGDITAHLDTAGGAEIGSGHLSIFDNGADTTIHIQFDSWDIGAATGNHRVIILDYDAGGNINGLASIASLPYTNHYIGIWPTTNDNYPSGEHDQTAYTTTYYSADYDFVDNGGYSTLTVDRTNTTYPKPSWVIISNGTATLTQEYKATGATQNLIMTDPVIYLDVGFGALGGNETKTFYLGGSPGSTQRIAVNLWEKYSNAILINQAISVTPATGGSGEIKTSAYGETLYFDVVPGVTYWFNASRSGFDNYNESYSIPTPPGIYSVYMERTLTPIANMSYAHFSVIDQTNGGLVPNAAIVLSDGQSKLTNSAGYSWFSVNSSTPYTYTVSKTGYYIAASGSFNISADTKILVALQRSTGPTPTWVLPSWTPVTVPTTSGSGGSVVPTLSAQLRQQNVQQGMDVWYTNLPFISQFLFLLFIIGGLGLMAGGDKRR